MAAVDQRSHNESKAPLASMANYGVTFCLRAACSPASLQEILDRTLVEKGSIYAFLELHIEQGPILEREVLQLGIVTAIAAPAALRVTFQGSGGHAGALLMPDRHTAPPQLICKLSDFEVSPQVFLLSGADSTVHARA